MPNNWTENTVMLSKEAQRLLRQLKRGIAPDFIRKELISGELPKSSSSFDKHEIADYFVETIEIGGFPVHIFESKKSAPELLYFHGGAFIYGLGEDHFSFLNEILTTLSVRILLPAYGLLPDSNYMQLYNLFEGLNSSTYFKKNWTIMGDSVGGGIALLFVNFIEERLSHPPKAVFLLCPWIDFGFSTSFETDKDPFLKDEEGMVKAAQLFAQDRKLTDEKVNPFYLNLTASFPVYQWVAGTDRCSIASLQFHHKLLQNGVEIHSIQENELFHIWMLAEQLPEAVRTKKEIIDRLNSCLFN